LQLNSASKNEIDRWRMPLMTARLREVEGYPQEKELILAKLREILR
jgi:hypothetical protein